MATQKQLDVLSNQIEEFLPRGFMLSGFDENGDCVSMRFIPDAEAGYACQQAAEDHIQTRFQPETRVIIVGGDSDD